MTSEQFKAYSEAIAENYNLRKRVDKLEHQLASHKREIDKLKKLVDDLTWGSPEE